MPKRRFSHLLFLGVLPHLMVSAGRPRADDDSPPRTATIVVATADSSDRSKAAADLVGDGNGDQEEINAAIRALPQVGGCVLLMEGTYDIRRAKDQLGGVLIERSHVTLAGLGESTRLVLAPAQNINVVRVLGADIGHVTVRDLVVDGNRRHNNAGVSPPNLEHKHFEFCAIKVYGSDPRVGGGKFAHDITVRNCNIKNAYQLGVMMEGRNMRCLDNILGDCGSDCVELLGGPGIIRGNYVEITQKVHVAVGSDRANEIAMQNNVVHVRRGGKLDIGFRSWAGSDRHVINGNILKVDAGGLCHLAMDIRGRGAVVSANNIYTANSAERTRLRITAGNVLVSGNMLENVVIEVNDETDEGKQIIVGNNILQNSSVAHKSGKLRELNLP